MLNEECGFNMPSRLFHLKPLGIGTPYVERFTGYIKRLAEAHSVSPGKLLEKEILPAIDRGYLKVSNFFGAESFNLDAMDSEVSESIVRVLEEKTCCPNLKYLTMSAWKELFCSRNLFNKSHAWCPICFQESLRLKQPVYEQLIWTIKDVDICGKHQTRLVRRCPHCNCKFNSINGSSRIGFCDKCKSWLGSNEYKNEQISSISMDWQNWVYNNIGELIALSPSAKDASNFVFVENVTNILNSNSLSVNEFANIIDISKQTTYRWFAGSRPSLTHLLGLSFILGHSIYSIFTEDMGELNLKLRNERIRPENINKKRISLNEVEKVLDESISLNKGISIKKLCEYHKIDYSYIKKHFPDEIAIIKENYNECLKERQLDKLNQIKNMMISIFQRGAFPSKNALTREFGRRMVQNDYEKKVWLETLEELGCTYEDFYHGSMK